MILTEHLGHAKSVKSLVGRLDTSDYKCAYNSLSSVPEMVLTPGVTWGRGVYYTLHASQLADGFHAGLMRVGSLLVWCLRKLCR